MEEKRKISHELVFWLYFWRLVILKPITTKYLNLSLYILLGFILIILLLSFYVESPRYIKKNSAFIVMLGFMCLFAIDFCFRGLSYGAEYMYQLIMFGFIPCFLLIRIKDLGRFFKVYYWTSLILFFVYAFEPMSGFGLFSNYMIFGFQVVLPAFFGIDIGRSYLKIKWAWIPEILCVIEIIVFANRSCILSVLLYFIIKEFYLNRNSIKSLLRRLFVVVAGLVVAFNYIDIVKWVSNTLAKLGFSSYSFTQYMYYIENGYFATANGNTGGRSSIFSDAIEMFKEAPVFGNGAGSFVDRYGYYTHNIITDLLVQFGIIVTVVFTIIVLKTIVKMIKNSNSTGLRYLTILSICMWCPKLFFSTEMFQDLGIWCFLAIGLGNLLFEVHDPCGEDYQVPKIE